jgi:ribonuclease T1
VGIGVAGLISLAPVQAREQSAPPGSVALAQLPAEARTVHRAIFAGGPFLYSKDGSVFGNREHILPAHPRGFYREYTVPTPGARDRGARRIICGGRKPIAPVACFYTGDHYASFRQITP